MQITRDPLLQPFKLKNLTLKNRVTSTPHAPAYPENGKPTLRYQLYHEEKAKGGIGMTMFGGSSFVASDTPSVFGQIDVSTDDIIPYFQQFSERIHKHDCGLVCQISHLGRRTTWNAGNWMPVVAPSRVREPSHRAFPREMDRHDIKRVLTAYVAGARRCQQGDLDGTEILTHGHLPEQFLSPATNFRTDEYGGSLENRMRFTMQMLEEVRAAVGDRFILGVRVGANEQFKGGYGLSEGIEAAQMVSESGLVDYMTVNFGHTVLFCEEARKLLLGRGGGTLCVFSSVAGDVARKPVVLYGAAKAGLTAYLDGLDLKFRAQGLKTVCVKP